MARSARYSRIFSLNAFASNAVPMQQRDRRQTERLGVRGQADGRAQTGRGRRR